jgi:penicillin-binding protein 1A
MAFRRKSSAQSAGFRLLNPNYKRYRRILLGLVGLVLLGGLAFVIYVGQRLPNFRALEDTENDLSTVVYSRDNKVLGNYFAHQNRLMVNMDEIPPSLKDALVATEDIRFYQHPGVDLIGLFRAAGSIALGGSMQGGSTLTMQLARNLYDKEVGRDRTILRKIKEMVAAGFLERRYTKAEIMTHYLNTVPFGGQRYGVESAARHFYGKECEELGLNEAAMLVGMLKAPTSYDPIRYPQQAKARRNTVLRQMKKYNFISSATADSVMQLSLGARKSSSMEHNEGMATYFRTELKKWLKNWCNKNDYNMYTDGLKVYTTIDSRMQQYAEAAVEEHLSEYQQVFNKHTRHYKPWNRDTSILWRAMYRSARYNVMKSNDVPHEKIVESFHEPRKMRVFTWKEPGYIDTTLTPWDSLRYYAKYLQTGLVTMQPNSGEILAWVGGIDQEFFQYDHVRKGKRQVGSTFKPFVYTAAFDNNRSPCSMISNRRFTMKTKDGKTWSPRNASGDYSDCVRLREALANSINVPTARLMRKIGPEVVAEYAHRMGIKTELEKVPSLALGTEDLNVKELTSAYCTIANKGQYIEPHFITRIEDRNGNILYQKVPNSREALSAQTAYLMIDMLRSVINAGTGVSVRYRYNLDYKIDIGGKTGTTQENSDGWFMGFTPRFCTGVWVGHADRNVHFRSTRLGQGARMALPIWAIYMKKVYNDEKMNIQPRSFQKPKEGLRVEINCKKYDQNHPNNDCRSGYERRTWE